MQKILVIGAMKVETDELISKLSDAVEIKIAAFSVTSGVINNTNVYVCCCGIGKVNASSAASAILSLCNDISLVINLGVAGGIGNGIKQGDIVIAERTVQHDCDSTADGLKKGQVNGFVDVYFTCDATAVAKLTNVIDTLGYNFSVGVIASGDQFINSNVTAASIRDNFNALACDMESAAINHVCALYSKPFVAMRAISDNGDDVALCSFYDFLNEAARRSTNVILEFLSK